MKKEALLLAAILLVTACGSGEDIGVIISTSEEFRQATLTHTKGVSACPDYIDVISINNDRTTPIEVELPNPSVNLVMTDGGTTVRPSGSRYTLQPGETLWIKVWFTCAEPTSLEENMTFRYYDEAGDLLGEGSVRVRVTVVE